MSIVFPNSPSTGDSFTASNGIIYSYDGEKWITTGTNSAGIWTKTGTSVGLTTATDDLNIDSNTLFVDASTNRVGIGTTSPGAIVQIESTAANAARLRIAFDSTRYYDIFRGSTTNSGLLNFYGSQSGFTGYVFDGVDGERMRIDSSGKVGIGTSNPQARLHLGSTDATLLKLQASAASTYINFINSSNALGYIGYEGTSLGFYNNNQKHFQIDVDSTIKFSNASTEHMRIDSSGKVGIGVTPPNYGSGRNSLDIHSSGSAITHFGITNSTTGSGGASNGFNIIQNGLNTQLYLRESGFMSFSTAATERMQIDSSGRILIGTTAAPAGTDAQYSKFSIRGNTLNTNAAYFSIGNGKSTASTTSDDNLGIITFNDNDSDGGEYARIIGASDGANGTNDYPGKLKFLTTSDGGSVPTERMRIDSSGRVGINTSTYSDTATALVIKNGVSGSDHTLLDIVCNTNETCQVRFSEDGSNFPGQIVYDTFGHDLKFKVNSAERMRINSSGRVGINTSSPAATLSVDALAGNSTVCLLKSPTVNAYLQLANSANDQGYVGYQSSDMTFYTTGSERLRIASSGNVGIGNQNPQARLHLGSTDATLLKLQASAASAYINFTNTSNALGYIGYEGTSLGFYTNNQKHFQIDVDSTIKFSNGATERMRIDSSGRVLIAKSASNFANVGIELRENGEVVVTRSGGDVITTRRLVSEGTHFSLRNISGISVGTIVTTSSSTAYNTSSDYRLKENVVDIADGITRVKQLQPKRFNFIADAETTVDGFLAHEAQQVVPEAVTGEKDGDEMQGIDQAKLVPLLTAALQEAIGEIETLKQRLSDAGI